MKNVENPFFISNVHESIFKKINNFKNQIHSGNGGTTGITIESPHCKRKTAPLMGEAKNPKRESIRNQSSEQTGIHLIESTPKLCQSLFPC